MKLTTQRLKKLIREELNKINESDQSREDPETLYFVMDLFHNHEVEDAVTSAIHYRIADSVLRELIRLEQDAPNHAKDQYSIWIEKLRFGMYKHDPQTEPFFDDDDDINPPLDI